MKLILSSLSRKRRFPILALFSCLGITPAMAHHKENIQPVVYHASSRGDVILEHEKQYIDAKPHKPLPKENLYLSTANNAFITVALSNMTFFHLERSSALLLEKFSQETFDEYPFPPIQEPSTSHLTLNMNHGQLYVLGRKAKATSSFVIKTPIAAIQINSSKFKISVKNNLNNVIIYTGYATIIDPKTKSTIKRIGENSFSRIAIANDTGKLRIEHQESIPDHAAHGDQKTFRRIEFSRENTLFHISGKTITASQAIHMKKIPNYESILKSFK